MEVKQQIATEIEKKKTTAVVKHYGIECRSAFSTEGSFGLVLPMIVIVVVIVIKSGQDV